jgi:hypothetical protein
MISRNSILLTALVACDAAEPTANPHRAPADLSSLVEGSCAVTSGEEPDSLASIACTSDFLALASEQVDESIPGARSVKVVLDQADANALYFQHSVRFPIHYEFVSTHLSGGTRPIVPDLATFNSSEYFSPERRFILGAVTYYEGARSWTIELSPYDTASTDMIASLYGAVANAAFFGPSLAVHATSEAQASVVDALPFDVPVVTTDELYAGTDFQPLSLGTAIGRLHFTTAASLASEYVPHEDIVVLDEAPNDISVVQGLVTEEFQTPLSHVNVLSRNRRTPNMGLRGATSNETLRAYDGMIVELTVTASDWSIRGATLEEAEAYWESRRPEAVVLPPIDLDRREIVGIELVTPDPTGTETLRDAIKEATRAYGGKSAQYSILYRAPGIPVRKAFAIPIWFYDLFMESNGFWARVDELEARSDFRADASVRDAELARLRADMASATVDGAFQEALRARIRADFPGFRYIRFRTSTNSEDLEGFPCAGCYESHSGDMADWEDVLDAIRQTYASAWLFRTFEERAYYGVEHRSVGMGLLVHAAFPDEEANGVAVTNNPYDSSGLEPAFYVNVQLRGDVEVVHPPPGVTSDQFLYYYSQPNQPITYVAHSSLVDEGDTVLTAAQIHELGEALAAIHEVFSPAYGPASGNTGWYAMDVEFKFDDDTRPDEPPRLYVKQARPYPTVEEDTGED